MLMLVGRYEKFAWYYNVQFAVTEIITLKMCKLGNQFEYSEVSSIWL